MLSLLLTINDGRSELSGVLTNFAFLPSLSEYLFDVVLYFVLEEGVRYVGLVQFEVVIWITVSNAGQLVS